MVTRFTTYAWCIGRVTFTGEMVEEAGEVLELHYFTLDELPGDLTPLDRPVLDDLKRQAARS
jgi:hypothetical protein